ncbi:hypothetical protein AB0N09_31525 [Streptomyces erythrochromogenes]|uniref:hypothetical protein n=1 Tax=Streptomyces erythrochromogenes TaxID=285574 RepID=UPI003420DF0A
MTVRPAWLLPTGQTREDTRLAPLGTYTPETELRTRDGVIPGGAPFAATGAGAMALQIAAGRAVVQGTTPQGAYPVALDAPQTLTITDGEAQFTRVDTVALRVLDQLFDEHGQNLARIEVVVGEATATPTPPILPPACLRLWDIRVPPGTSAGVGGINWASALTDRRRYTVAAGGIPPGGTAADAGAYDGQYADHDGRLMRWSQTSASWRPVVERHYASAVKSNTYNLPANTYTKIQWTGTDAATPGMWSSAASTRLTAPVGGLYVVYAHQTWSSGATQARTRVQINNGGDIQLSHMASSSGGQGIGAARPLVLAAGDYVEMSVFSGAALTAVPGNYSKLALQWIGPA